MNSGGCTLSGNREFSRVTRHPFSGARVVKILPWQYALKFKVILFKDFKTAIPNYCLQACFCLPQLFFNITSAVHKADNRDRRFCFHRQIKGQIVVYWQNPQAFAMLRLFFVKGIPQRHFNQFCDRVPHSVFVEISTPKLRGSDKIFFNCWISSRIKIKCIISQTPSDVLGGNRNVLRSFYPCASPKKR